MGQASSAHTDRLASAHDQLVAAVEALTSGDDWRAMLDVASRFHQYSANNVLMILHQRPTATRVAGYRTWQGLGRQVRKGEKGIAILAPIVRTMKGRDEETGEEVTLRSLAAFRVVHVFDVAQTDGDELPNVAPALLDGDGPALLWDGLAGQVKGYGYTLERGVCPGGANGVTDHVVRTVRVRDDVSDAQAVKTLCHELAHVILHPAGFDYQGCRGVAEVEAESVAYLVCGAAGMATDGYSFPYVARWADGDAKKVQDTAERVLRAARTILEVVGSAVGAEAA